MLNTLRLGKYEFEPVKQTRWRIGILTRIVPTYGEIKIHYVREFNKDLALITAVYQVNDKIPYNKWFYFGSYAIVELLHGEVVIVGNRFLSLNARPWLPTVYSTI